MFQRYLLRHLMFMLMRRRYHRTHQSPARQPEHPNAPLYEDRTQLGAFITLRDTPMNGSPTFILTRNCELVNKWSYTTPRERRNTFQRKVQPAIQALLND